MFHRLPLPYVNEDFDIDSTIRDFAEAVYKPPPYTSIRRSILNGDFYVSEAVYLDELSICLFSSLPVRQ